MGTPNEVRARLAALLLARPAPAPDAVAAALAGGEGERLLAAAIGHGLLSALLERAPRPALAPALRARLERQVAGLRVQDARARGTLGEVARALAAAGAAPVALKGPALADRLYPDPTLRPSSDLDLLVAPEALDAAVAALAPLGYAEHGDAFTRGYARAHHHHLHLERRGGVPVELHFRASVGLGATLDAGPLLARALPAPGWPGLRVLAPDDELVFLAVHSTRHVHERLGWLLDLARFLDAAPVGGDALAAAARRAGAARAVASTFAELARLGHPVPAALLAPLSPRRARAASALASALLGRAEVDRAGHLLRMLREAVLTDRAATATRRLAHHVVWFVRRNTHRLLHRARRGPVGQ